MQLSASTHTIVGNVKTMEPPPLFCARDAERKQVARAVPVTLAATPPLAGRYFAALPPGTVATLFGGAIRDTDVGAVHSLNIPVNDYDLRVWVPEGRLQDSVATFCVYMRDTHGAVCSSDLNQYSAHRPRRKIKLFGGELDVSFECVPLGVLQAPEAGVLLAKTRAVASDAGISGVALDASMQAWGLPDYTTDRDNRTVTVYPPWRKPLNHTLAYGEKCVRKFGAGFRVVRKQSTLWAVGKGGAVGAAAEGSTNVITPTTPLATTPTLTATATATITPITTPSAALTPPSAGLLPRTTSPSAELGHRGDVVIKGVDAILGRFLFLSDMHGAKDPETVARLGITHVVNATNGANRNYHAHSDHGARRVQYLNPPIEDDEGAAIEQAFAPVFEFVQQGHKVRGRVLIHCLCGVSRSATLTIAYLMQAEEMSLKEAFALVKARRPMVAPNPHFAHALLAHERKLFPARTPANTLSVEDMVAKNYRKPNANASNARSALDSLGDNPSGFNCTIV